MPFLESGSFDGVLSHYALYYVSPIGMRQVLRETHRLLVPGGRLLIYVAATGLGSGDETRTVPYSPAALRALLARPASMRSRSRRRPTGETPWRRRGARQTTRFPLRRGTGFARADRWRHAAFSRLSRWRRTVECELVGRSKDDSELRSALRRRRWARTHEFRSARALCRSNPGVPSCNSGSGADSLAVSECFRFEFAATEMR